MQNKQRKKIASKATLRVATVNAVIMFVIIIGFDMLFFIVGYNLLTRDVEVKIKHELEHLENFIIVSDDSLKLTDKYEFRTWQYNALNTNALRFQINDKSGNVLFKSRNMPESGKLDPSYNTPIGTIKYKDAVLEGEAARTGTMPITNLRGEIGGFLTIAAFKTAADEFIQRLLLYNFIGLPVVIFIIIMTSVFMANRSYQTIQKIISLARSISTANLSQRLEYEADPNEALGQLRDTLNDLFERLENQVTTIRHFTDNASHQLMTPLTVLKSELEYVLKRDHSVGTYKDTLEIVKKQTDRMITIVKTMLILANESRESKEERSIFSISNLFEQFVKPLYKEQNIEYHIPDDVYCRGNSEHFFLVIQNLIDNAVKYSAEGSPVIISLFYGAENIKIVIEDFGRGIPTEDKDRIFDRFYRGQEAEDSGVKGYGLGLSLVQTVINSMGGRIYFEANNPRGTRFIILLPSIKLT